MSPHNDAWALTDSTAVVRSRYGKVFVLAHTICNWSGWVGINHVPCTKVWNPYILSSCFRWLEPVFLRSGSLPVSIYRFSNPQCWAALFSKQEPLYYRFYCESELWISPLHWLNIHWKVVLALLRLSKFEIITTNPASSVTIPNFQRLPQVRLCGCFPWCIHPHLSNVVGTTVEMWATGSFYCVSYSPVSCINTGFSWRTSRNSVVDLQVFVPVIRLLFSCRSDLWLL